VWWGSTRRVERWVVVSVGGRPILVVVRRSGGAAARVVVLGIRVPVKGW